MTELTRTDVAAYAANHGWKEHEPVADRSHVLLVKHRLTAGGWRSVFVYFTDDGRVEYAASQTTRTKAVVIRAEAVLGFLRDYGA